MNLIKAQSKEERDRVKALYLSAFPKEERKPFDLIISKQKAGSADILSIIDKGEFCGLAITAQHNDIVILVFFAISDSKRGLGYGSKALQLIAEKYKGKRLILEIEDTKAKADNIEQRLKRKSFYIKNGMLETGLMSNVMGVAMEVMANTKNISYSEYWDVYDHAFGREISDMVKEIK